jgi:hypothetical protein
VSWCDFADQRKAAWRRGQIPAAQEIPSAKDDMGRRRDSVLLQGAFAQRLEGVLHAKSLPDARREARARQADGADPHAGQQLVQEQEAARQDAADTASSPPRLQRVSLFSHFFCSLTDFQLILTLKNDIEF